MEKKKKLASRRHRSTSSVVEGWMGDKRAKPEFRDAKTTRPINNHVINDYVRSARAEIGDSAVVVNRNER